MTTNAPRVAALIVQVQGDFLETPTLPLTAPQAEPPFGLTHAA
jgi:hypothetical protein